MSLAAPGGKPPPPDVPPAPFGRWRALVLAGVFGAGGVLLSLPPVHALVPHDLQRLGGATLGAYGVFVALAWFPMPWLGRRIEALFEDLVEEGRSGWYLAVAVGHFALAEVADLVLRWGDAGSFDAALRAQLVDQLVGFSADSFMNVLWASLWPVDLLRAHGFERTLGVAAFAWGVWQAGRRVFGEPDLGRAARDPARGDR